MGGGSGEASERADERRGVGRLAAPVTIFGPHTRSLTIESPASPGRVAHARRWQCSRACRCLVVRCCAGRLHRDMRCNPQILATIAGLCITDVSLPLAHLPSGPFASLHLAPPLTPSSTLRAAHFTLHTLLRRHACARTGSTHFSRPPISTFNPTATKHPALHLLTVAHMDAPRRQPASPDS